MKRLNIFIGLLVLSTQLGAKIYTPDSTAAFFDVINQHPYAVVHFINYAQVNDDKLKEQALTSMKTEFAQSSNESQHVLANIAFIGINSKVAPNVLSEVESRNGLKKDDNSKEFSVVFLYNDGKPVVDSTGYLATLTDAFDQGDLGVFVQKYLGDYIGYQVQQAQAYQASQPTTVTRYVEQPVYYSTPTYYSDDYYYRRPRIGFGLGLGWGGYGWGGWRRRGWGGPGFGFGIGF